VSPLVGTRYDMHAANWTYGTCMLVLDVCAWSRCDVLGLRLTEEDVGLLRGGVNFDKLT
jgi:hypothetical protein